MLWILVVLPTTLARSSFLFAPQPRTRNGIQRGGRGQLPRMQCQSRSGCLTTTCTYYDSRKLPTPNMFFGDGLRLYWAAMLVTYMNYRVNIIDFSPMLRVDIAFYIYIYIEGR